MNDASRCQTPGCDRPSLGARSAAAQALFTEESRAYCCAACRWAYEGGWYDRDNWGVDSDHMYGCLASLADRTLH